MGNVIVSKATARCLVRSISSYPCEGLHRYNREGGVEHCVVLEKNIGRMLGPVSIVQVLLLHLFGGQTHVCPNKIQVIEFYDRLIHQIIYPSPSLPAKVELGRVKELLSDCVLKSHIFI